MSSLLEVFGIQFDSDAAELDKGAKNAEKTVDSLEDQVKRTDAVTEKLGSKFNDLISNASAAFAGILGIGAVTAGIVTTAASTDAVGKFSEVLGQNIEDVQAWDQAVIRSGGTAGAFQGTIQTLSQSLTDFALTGGGEAADVLARMGISAVDSSGKVKSAFDLLPDIADKFAGLSEGESFGLGQKLGLDQGTILLLQQGSEAVDDLVEKQRRLGVASKEDARVAAEFNDAMSDSKQVFNSLFVTIGTTILPAFTEMLGLFQDGTIFLRDNGELVAGFFIGVAGAVVSVYLPAIQAAAASTLAAVAPFLLIGLTVAAIGTAFALIWDDIQNFIKGNDSIIGRIASQYPAIGALAKGLISVFGGLFKIIKAVSGVLLDVFMSSVSAAFTVMESLAGIVLSVIDTLLGGFSGLGDGMVGSIESAVDVIIGLIEGMGDIVTGFFDSIGSAAEGVAGFFGIGDDATINQVNENISKASGTFKNIDANPLNGQTSNSIVNSTRNINREYNMQFGDTTIQTAAVDAEGIAKVQSESMSKELKYAIESFDDGVAI